MTKKFLIPVSFAVTALMANNAEAKIQAKPIGTDEKSVADQANSVAEREESTTHVAQYLKGDEKHDLLIKKSDAGLIFAAHGSHSSHGSHGSHRSGR